MKSLLNSLCTQEEGPVGGKVGFDYLLNMPILSLTMERVNNLQVRAPTLPTVLSSLLPPFLLVTDTETVPESVCERERKTS